MEKLGTATNALNWFEIPVTDVARAKKFYETSFDIEPRFRIRKNY
jgi:predicted enzyme related to lactoylglutathione lyase